MEVDRILYIFGSFTRKKDKRKSFDQSSISAGNSPLHLTKRTGRPASQNLEIAPRTSAYDGVMSRRKSREKEWECGLCKRELVEPRLLGCLHSFCTRCLLGLHQEGEAEAWHEVDGGSIQLDPDSGTASGTGSAGSGYDSDLRHSGSDGSWEKKPIKYGIFTRKESGKSAQFLLCPSCRQETPLPLGGVSALPVNYVLLRKMALAEQERDEDLNVLCDLCTTDNKAASRCTQCLVSVCPSCQEAHRRQQATARHSLHPLHPRDRKHCGLHPRSELTVYCATCQVVICRDCCVVSHEGHALANAARAAGERARVLREACDRTRHTAEHAEELVRKLNQHTREMDSQAAAVEASIASWSAAYLASVERHTQSLRAAAARARGELRAQGERGARGAAERGRSAGDAVRFAEELLSQCSEDEVLSLSGGVLRRLERVSSPAPALRARTQLRFDPAAPAADPGLVGRLTTRVADPAACRLDVEGLQDLRVDCPHEAILEIRDHNGEKIWCGGEQVCAYFRRRDSSSRPARLPVCARADGRYELRVVAASPGAYLLAVTVDAVPIQGSPFPCAVRKRRVSAAARTPCSACSCHNTQYNGVTSDQNYSASPWSCYSTDKPSCSDANLYHVSL